MSNKVNLYGKMLNFSTLKFETDNLEAISSELSARLAKNPVQGMPIVVDSEKEIDIDGFFDLLRKMNFQPIGIVDGVLTETAIEKNIAVFPRGKALEKIKLSEKPKENLETAKEANAEDVEEETNQGKTLVFERILRSGQSISNTEGDLVLMNGINDGAEAISTGSLHIYGKAQGRIVAGATGEPNAAIFCQHLAASLVSLAGVYCTRENIPSDMIGKSVHIKYDKDKGLIFNEMNPNI